MTRSAYPNDLTDAGWKVLQPFLPPEAHGGRLRRCSVRERLNGILSVLRGGIAWRAMPHDLPLANRVPRPPVVESPGRVGRAAHHPPRTGASAGRSRRDPKCGRHRQPIGENHRDQDPPGLDAGDRQPPMVGMAGHLGAKRRTSTIRGGAKGPRCPQAPLGGRAAVCVVGQIQAPGQGLRGAGGHRGEPRVPGHDPLDGAPAGTSLP